MDEKHIHVLNGFLVLICLLMGFYLQVFKNDTHGMLLSFILVELLWIETAIRRR